MARKHNYKIGDPINAGTFRKYIEHFYNGVLRNAGKVLGDDKGAIERPTFVAVAHSLLSTGDFKSGERFRLSQVAIADISGASTKSVRRVLGLLEALGAIRVVDTSKRPGGGKPVKVYTLTYSPSVDEVLRDLDRNKLGERWKRPQRLKQTDSDGRTNPSAMGVATPLNGRSNPIQWEPQPHNKNLQEQERKDSDKSSPAPSSLSPSARDGAADDAYDERLSSIGFDIEEFLATLNEL
ncbi:hypothetical protein KEC56_12630 [Microbacterium sp. YMB-B2]|uniref:Helix-turn-helix domain-containing protein n=1 Tax=Microbacterium tenebrionis TaxID=2830665 RepID=A0A9X1LR99_9MICO|nr:helix-turn-helix domain-containing protein [Microbacterium tenebrionis]MCC2030347.1 hypothetical protein [Microbacterium tenebrionis]